MCDSQVSITWYCGKQCSLVFGGNMASELKGQFIRIAANEMEETTIGDQRRTATNTHDGTSSPVNIFEDSLNELSERNISETGEFAIASVTTNNSTTIKLQNDQTRENHLVDLHTESIGVQVVNTLACVQTLAYLITGNKRLHAGYEHPKL